MVTTSNWQEFTVSFKVTIDRQKSQPPKLREHRKATHGTSMIPLIVASAAVAKSNPVDLVTAAEGAANAANHATQRSAPCSAAKRLKVSDEHAEAAPINNLGHGALAREMHKKVRGTRPVS